MARSIAARVDRDLESASRSQYATNKVQNAYPSLLMFLPISILRQYVKPLSFYFLVISALGFVKEISPFAPMPQLIPVLLVLSISVFRECIQERNRQVDDNRLNSQTTRININGTWSEVKWEDVCVGDVILISSDSPCPADIVLVASGSPGNSTYIQTTNLDGETNYKPRFGLDKAAFTLDLMTSATLPVDGRARPEIIVHADAPRSDLDYFHGEAVFHLPSETVMDPEDSGELSPAPTSPKSVKLQPIEVCELSVKNFIPREAVIRGTEWVIGVVVYTGTDTKVLLGQQKPGYKVSKIDRITNQLVILIIFMQCAFGLAAGLSTAAYSNQARWWLFGADLSESELLLESIIAFFSAVLLVATVIPISLVISLEIAKVYQAKFMVNDVLIPGTDTPSQALNDDLGQIGYILSDKTGTLTSNDLVLKKATVAGIAFPDLDTLNLVQVTNDKVGMFVDALSLCHDIAPNWSADLAKSAATRLTSVSAMKKQTDKERIVRSGVTTPGTPGDLSDLGPVTLSYCGESPDEICLVTACSKSLGRILNKRSQSSITILHADGGSTKWSIVRFFAFDNLRRMSSIVVTKPEWRGSDKLLLLTKGSDDSVLPKCLFRTPAENVELATTLDSLQTYAKESLRTLVFGCKWVSRADLVGTREAVIDRMESGLTLLGCTGTEDSLQPGVQGSIHRLRIAGIAVWMITGDKLDTAVEISKSANLLSVDMQRITIDITDEEEGRSVLDQREKCLTELEASLAGSNSTAVVLTGRSIRHLTSGDSRLIQGLLACKSVVVCRATKDQKAQIVQLVQKAVNGAYLTLAIGDGANDVPMIKQADVGVGIAGKEGRQAAQNADYVISQFSHIERLLLFHGRLNYVRTSKMVLYFIFKNLVLALPFALHSVGTTLFSSSSLITSSISLSFNTLLTALPVFALGLLERDVSPDDRLIAIDGIPAHRLVREYPKLYMTGRLNRMFTKRLLAGVFIASIVIGAWIYVTSFTAVSDLYAANSDGKMLDHWAVSQVYFIAVFLVDTGAAVLISEGLTMPLAASVMYSCLLCLTFFISDAFDPGNPAGLTLWEMLTQTHTFAPILLLALLPPLMIGIAMKSWKWRFNPTARMIWQQAKEKADKRRRLIRTLVKSNPQKKEHILKRHVSVLQQRMSYLYHPEELETEFRKMLIPKGEQMPEDNN